MSDLKVCPKCGWYDAFRHEQSCDPERGKAAAKLAALLPGIQSTMLGYGDGHMCFELNDECHVKVDCPEKGEGGFSADPWINGYYSAEDVAELVRAIANTQIGRGLAKREP